MRVEITTWSVVTGAILWKNHGKELLTAPVFLSERLFKTFDEKFRMMDPSRVTVTIVEHQKHYSVIIYEDLKERMMAEFGFIMTEMDLKGQYRNFLEEYKPSSSKVFLSYAKHIISGRPENMDASKIKMWIEPFEIKKFRIIPESDLRLDEFQEHVDSGTSYQLQDFKYADEARAVMCVREPVATEKEWVVGD